ncbi:DUF3558 domain-containing protein [Streptomyces sp. NPDC093085]|uniref:DUF3558 domain-containing protein n=1 Tax=Streptomyces sp. NPDC093085 TaxID=3155068 RepID=UPI003444E146
MQFKARRAYVPGLAALLVAAVAGCSAGGGDGGAAGDSKTGETAGATVAQPGKYRTLREACGTVPRATLKDLLPGAATLTADQQEKTYRGTAAVTYDTDRRVGCSWRADSPAASNTLVIDVERVVSYDPAVSDDDRAQEVYEKKQADAHLAPADPTPTGSGSGSGGSPSATGPAGPSGNSGGSGNSGTQTVSPSDAPSDAPSGSASGSPSPSGSGSPSDAPSGSAPGSDGLEPRVLTSIGDAAFLDDVLARSGSAAQRRTVSVVFRTSNVIVTIRYAEQPALATEVPDSKELQDKAQGLARTLVDELND